MSFTSTRGIELRSLRSSDAIRSGPSKPSPVVTKSRNIQKPTPVVDVEEAVNPVAVYDEIYGRFTPRRKLAITSILAYCSCLTSIASSVILAAIPEVAATYKTTGDLIGVSNALFLLFMGLSPCICGPLTQIYGRRWVNELTSSVSIEANTTLNRSLSSRLSCSWFSLSVLLSPLPWPGTLSSGF